MTKVLYMLDDSEPVHGDIDTTDALMATHSVSMSAHPVTNDPLSNSPPLFPFSILPFLPCFSLLIPPSLPLFLPP